MGLIARDTVNDIRLKKIVKSITKLIEQLSVLELSDKVQALNEIRLRDLQKTTPRCSNPRRS